MSDSRTIWCGNLSEKVTQKLLYELFFQAGPLKNVTIPEDENGCQKNYALITYHHKISVQYAMAIFQGTVLFQRALKLKTRSTAVFPPSLRCNNSTKKNDPAVKAQEDSDMTEKCSWDSSVSDDQDMDDSCVVPSCSGLQGNGSQQHHSIPIQSDRDPGVPRSPDQKEMDPVPSCSGVQVRHHFVIGNTPDNRHSNMNDNPGAAHLLDLQGLNLGPNHGGLQVSRSHQHHFRIRDMSLPKISQRHTSNHGDSRVSHAFDGQDIDQWFKDITYNSRSRRRHFRNRNNPYYRNRYKHRDEYNDSRVCLAPGQLDIDDQFKLPSCSGLQHNSLYRRLIKDRFKSHGRDDNRHSIKTEESRVSYAQDQQEMIGLFADLSCSDLQGNKPPQHHSSNTDKSNESDE